ncbi:ketopantoate reductase family protein [Derxia gummosa]|uniref:2-dehydropantoate 2-reductase n=1 Tax=Derxia gummosa DSM 723 TaxID=1121388 RepID=A0A8B6X4G4_9BURK|nr:2-dehydropantoate 2-reductase [Derxia gummosa]
MTLASFLPPLRVGIAGAGAIGCTLAARFAAAGQRVSVLARGATLGALREHGITLDDLGGRVEARVHAGGADELGPQDLLFLCSKSQDLAALAAAARPMLGPDTVVIPTPNGVPWWYFHREGGRHDGRRVEAVDPDGRLAALIPLDQVLGAIVFITAEMLGPGRVRSTTPHLVMLGEPGGGGSERLRAACAALDAAGIEGRPLDRIRDKLWTKITANLTSNPLSVVTGATLDRIYGEPALVEIVRAMMREIAVVAASHGARLEIDPIEFIELGRAMGAVRTSMLQDHERGRPLELAAIGEAVLELAALYAIPMPTTSAVIALARHAARPALAA